MTRYEKVARTMKQDIRILRKLVVANDGKIPSKVIGKMYGIDSSASRGILLGLMIGMED